MKLPIMILALSIFFISPNALAQRQSLVESVAGGSLSPNQMPEAQKDQLLIDMARRLVAAENRVKQLEQQLNAFRNEARIKEAQAMFGEVQKLLTSMDFDLARKKMKELETKIPEVRQAKAFIDLESELTYIGREAGDLQVEKWFQGEASFKDAPITLMVFFETWCPHCQDEAPRLEQMFQAYRSRGVNVIGLTKVSETATEESVYGFITDYGVTFPVGKVTEAFGGRYGVESVPAGVILKNGKIVWRGKPDLIGGNTIEMILAAK